MVMFVLIDFFQGPLLSEDLDVQEIPLSLLRNLTIALCGMIGKSFLRLNSVVISSIHIFPLTLSHSLCILFENKRTNKQTKYCSLYYSQVNHRVNTN